MRKASLIIVLLVCSYNAFSQIRGRVVSVSAGDAFSVQMRDGRKVNIGLHGIDCPEKSQPYGSQARHFSYSYIYGKEVILKVLCTDKHGRKMCLVEMPDGKVLNEELLLEGLAWHYNRYDWDPHWDKLESAARQQRRGLWSDTQPIAPWAWNDRKRYACFVQED